MKGQPPLIPNRILATHRMRSELSQAVRGENPEQLQPLEWRHLEALLHAPDAPQSVRQFPAVARLHGGLNRNRNGTERLEQLTGKAHVGPYEWYY